MNGLRHALDGRTKFTLDCLLIADDLTGACDAAVHFAAAGYGTTACLHPAPASSVAEVLAVSTDTRDADPAAAECIVSQAAAALSVHSPSTLFKKIDSTLRGNVKQEIAAVLSTFGYDAAIVCPAFPRLHRVVIDGRLHVQGSRDRPLEVFDSLHAPRLEPCVSVRPQEVGNAVSRGARLVLVDACSDDDLDEVAAHALDSPVLWVGSGGLASALARTFPAKRRESDTVRPRGPLVFCVGSDHAVTAAQQAHLNIRAPVLTVSPTGIDPRNLKAALDQGRHVWVQVPRAPECSTEIGPLLRSVSPAPIVLSGGYTASLICRAASARTIDLIDEILPGIPYGVIHGGDCDGRIVVTKSGAFGNVDALSRIADFFA